MSMLSAILSLTSVVAISPDLAPGSEPQAIAGGETVHGCGWPSVVLLRGNGYLCTGNLIHPQVVVTAAHCIEVMDPNTRVYFGDTANTSYNLVDVEFCQGSPDFQGNDDGTIAFSEVQNDWGFCKLTAPFYDVPHIPPIYGCEIDQIQVGAEIVRVGYGKETLSTEQFFKRWVETTIVSIPFLDGNGWPAQLSEGGGGEGTCPGDSGGPAFIRIPAAAGGDESWRMIAVQSSQPVEDAEGSPIECGTEPNNTAVISQGLAFIEAESGIDVTPCFDVETGTWDPSFECSNFPIDPGLGGGSWFSACETGPLGSFSGACGTPFDQANPDSTPPNVGIVQPSGEVHEPYSGEPVAIHVVVDADDGPDGWGVDRVELVIFDDAGTVLTTVSDETSAYEWTPTFPKGTFSIQAIGYDNAGLVTQTETLPLYIGVDPPGAGTDDSSGDDESSGGASSGPMMTGGGGPLGTTGGGESSGSPDDDDGGDQDSNADQSGCGCRTGSGATTNLLVLFGLFGWRRRR